MVLEFLRDKELIEANPFATAKIKKLHFLPFLNLNPSDYGGWVKHVAELKDSDLYLIIDKDLKTIDVARVIDGETQAGEEVLQDETIKMIKCKKCNQEFEKGAKFLAHIKVCK